MRTVWKYPIVIGTTTIAIPKGWKVVLVDRDNAGSASVWVELDSKADLENVTFYVVGSGHPVPEDTKHIGSFVTLNFVWHVYA